MLFVIYLKSLRMSMRYVLLLRFPINNIDFTRNINSSLW